MRSHVVVTARLTRGVSSKRAVRFVAGEPPRRVTLGTSRACSWSVRAAGVTPQRLALCWTGRSLYLSCAPGTQPIHLDGRAVTEARLGDGAVIEFGEAALTIDEQEVPDLPDVLGEPLDPKKAVVLPGTYFGPFHEQDADREEDPVPDLREGGRRKALLVGLVLLSVVFAFLTLHPW